MSFTVTALGAEGVPGVLVEGLTPEHLATSSVGDRLRALWVDKGVIVFRGLKGPKEHLVLSRIFGTLTSHPTGNGLDAVHPELSDICYEPEKPSHIEVEGSPLSSWLIEVDGRPLGAWLPWHSDLVYFAEINRGGILRGIEPAKDGGMTGFIDQIAAYDRLPQRLKDKVENLNVVYWGNFRMHESPYIGVSVRTLREGKTLERIIEDRNKFPYVAHPMVYVQAETGRKVLNVSPWFAQFIEGMQTPEGDALLTEVIQYCSDESHAYFHRWESEDMVLWDNWRMLHKATGISPDQRRIMQRTTIMGDYGLGRVYADAPGADTLKRLMV